jgi:hypothetical protein
MPPISKRCPYCRKTFSTQRSVNQHISASTTCLKEWHKDIVRKDDNTPKCRPTNSPEPKPHDDFPCPDLTHEFDDAANQTNLEDEDDTHEDHLATPKRYFEPFPGRAGDALRQEKTRFETLEEEQRLEGKLPWEPFASREEWGLAEWLMKNVGQTSTDQYLQLPIVR